MSKRVRVKKADMWKAIRDKCIDCSGGQPREVKHCVIPGCPLYDFRNGSRMQQNEDKHIERGDELSRK